MGKNNEVIYQETTVELSRQYPFGETNEVDTGKDKKTVTVLRVKELNGYDQEIITKNPDRLYGYMQIAVSTGIEYEEALMLALTDYETLQEALGNF